MKQRLKTIVVNQEVWFHICAANEVTVTYIGPFPTEESAFADLGLAECENAHFLTQYVPDFGEIHMSGPASSAWYEIDADKLSTVFDWVRDHNKAVMDHPIYKQAVKSHNSLRFFDEEELAEAFGVKD